MCLNKNAQTFQQGLQTRIDGVSKNNLVCITEFLEGLSDFFFSSLIYTSMEMEKKRHFAIRNK